MKSATCSVHSVKTNQQINIKEFHLLKFLALESLESLANQQINSFLHILLTLARTSFSNQQINAKKIHLLKFLALENLESLANQQINSFLHILLTLARTRT